MDVLIIMVFISLVLLAGALVLLLTGVKNGDFEQGDRLALLPLEPDDPPGLHEAVSMAQEDTEDTSTDRGAQPPDPR